MLDLATVSEAELSANLSSISRQLRVNRRVGRARVTFPRGKYIQLDFGRIGGKRLRRYAKSETSAYRLAWQITRELNEHGALAKALTSAQRYQATEAFRLLAPIGGDLLDVVKDYLKRHPLGGLARTVDDVRKEVVELKRRTGRSGRHVDGLDYKLRKLVEAIGNRAITSVTTADLEAELENHPDWKPTTVNSTVQGWKIMLNHAVKRGYIFENPANRLDLPKVIHDEPTIFSVTDVRMLMAATLFGDRHALYPHCRAYLAIGMFAGLRPEEIDRLEWQHVDLETRTIRVKMANAKDRDRRIVQIQPNLAAWLRPLAKCKGRVLPRPIADLRAAARSILGLAVWPHDIMRHTFVSYHFAMFDSEAATKKEVGHRDDGRVFYNHYMVPVSKQNARLFWSTVPQVDVLPCYEPGWTEAHPPTRFAAPCPDHAAPPPQQLAPIIESDALLKAA